MTKKEIREAYNNLTPVLQSKIDNYKAVTGKYYEDIITAGNMSPDVLTDYKDNLEMKLKRRETLIKVIEEATQRFYADQDFLATEEGKNFMDQCRIKKMNLESTYESHKDALIDEFNSYLGKIGLGDWKVDTNDIPTSLGIGINVYHVCSDARIRVYISKDANGGLAIEPSSSLICGCNIEETMMSGNPCPQYQQFKACCLIVEHKVEADAFTATWMGATKEMKNISSNIETMNKWMENPSEYATYERE